MASARHLVRRFATSLWPFGPGAPTEAWVATILTLEQQVLWARMSRADRRHAAGVARRVATSLGERATPPVLAAALLHDIGKLDARLGTYGRVVATLAGRATGGAFAGHWSASRGFTRRVGLYLRHAPIGADRLALAGSDPLTVAWAREHHLPAEEWTVPPEIGAALKAADDD